MQPGEISAGKGEFLLTSPTLYLAFARLRGLERRLFFRVKQFDGSAIGCERTTATLIVALDAIREVLRPADVEAAVGATN